MQSTGYEPQPRSAPLQPASVHPALDRHAAATSPRPLLEAAKFPPDDDDLPPGDPSDAFAPPAGGDMPGGFDDDGAVKQISRRTTPFGRVIFALLILGAVGIGIGAFVQMRGYDSRMDELNALANDETLSTEKFLEGLRELLPRTRHDDVREIIVRTLGKYKDVAAVPLLISELDHAGIVRRAAAVSLAQIGSPNADTAKPKLLEVLPDTDEKDRAGVVWALAVLKEPKAAPEIIEAFTRGQLQGQDGFDAKIISDVLGPTRLASQELTGHAEKSVRILVAQALSEAATPEVVAPLTRMLRDADLDVVRAAAVGLGRTGDPSAATPLFETLRARPDMKQGILDAIEKTTAAPGIAGLIARAEDPALKRTLAEMLARTHDPRAADPLAGLLADPDKETREAAAIGLAELGDGRAVNALVALAGDAERSTGDAALVALRKLGHPDSVRGLLALLPRDETDPMMLRRAALFSALAATGSAEAGPALEAALAGDDVETAAIALGRLKYEPAFRRLQGMLPRPRDVSFAQASVTNEFAYRNRLSAVRAMAFYGNEAVLPALMTIVEDPEDDRRIREAAAESIGLIAGPAAVQQVITKARDSNVDLVARALYVQGLWQRPRADSAPALLDLLTNPEADVRRAAALAVGYAGAPGLEDRLLPMLDNRDQRRDAAFAALLGGNEATTAKLLDVLKEDGDLREVLQMSLMNDENDWFNILTTEMFTSGQIWKRARVARQMFDGKDGTGYTYPWAQLLVRLKSGWDAPGGISSRDVREKLRAALTGDDATLRALVAELLGDMGERGILLAVRDSNGNGSAEARNKLRAMNTTSR